MPRYLEYDRYVYACDAPGCSASTPTGEGRKAESARIARSKGWKITPRQFPSTCRALCPAHKD